MIGVRVWEDQPFKQDNAPVVAGKNSTIKRLLSMNNWSKDEKKLLVDNQERIFGTKDTSELRGLFPEQPTVAWLILMLCLDCLFVHPENMMFDLADTRTYSMDIDGIGVFFGARGVPLHRSTTSFPQKEKGEYALCLYTEEDERLRLILTGQEYDKAHKFHYMIDRMIERGEIGENRIREIAVDLICGMFEAFDGKSMSSNYLHHNTALRNTLIDIVSRGKIFSLEGKNIKTRG